MATRKTYIGGVQNTNISSKTSALHNSNASSTQTSMIRNPNEPDRQAQLTNTVNPGMTTSYDISGTKQKPNVNYGFQGPVKPPKAGEFRSDVNPSSLAAFEGKTTSGGGGVGGSGGVYGSANFRPSDAYNQAMAYTNQLLAQLSSGRTSYTDQINSLMDTINNRAAFNYDPDNDPLFQQYLSSSMDKGKTAMTDTMAQASALTGGYGSTYATAAANGAYNNFIQDAYDNLPEYYQTALDTYNGETQNLYNKLGMYNTADQIEYDRLANAYQNNFAMANDIYGKDYTNYWDKVNYDTDMAKYNQDLAYKYASLAQDQAQFNAKMSAEKAAASASVSENGYEKPTEKQYTNAMKAYDEGGIEGVKAYLSTQPDNIDVDAIMDHVITYGKRTPIPEEEIKKQQIKAMVRGY